MARKLTFDQQIFEDVYRIDNLTSSEMAIPSYIHPNPFVRWIVTKRMFTLISYMDLYDGCKVLDYGCGTGMLLLQLPPDCVDYFGVDTSLWQADKILKAHNRKDFTLYDASDWDSKFRDNSIDCIVALEVLEHVQDVSSLLTSFSRILKPKGKFLISGPTENVFYRFARKIAGFSGEYHHRNIYDIMLDISKSDLKVRVRSKTLPLPPPFNLFMVSEYIRC